MARNRNILTECFAETALLEFLGFNKPIHKVGVSKVFGEINKRPDDRLIGIIDNDNQLIQSLTHRNFILKDEKFDLYYFKNKISSHALIVVDRDHEHWVLKYAERCKINLKKHNIPSDPKELKRKYTGSKRGCKQAGYQNFLKTLESSDSLPFKLLKTWINDALR